MPDKKFRSGNGPIKLSNLFSMIILLSFFIHFTSSYLVVVDEKTPANTIIFNASVNKLGSERHYKINVHKTAEFVHKLLHIDPKDGQIKLRKQLHCDGIFYPNLFTLYIDSISNHLRSVNYYSPPLRVFINGEHCNDEYNHEIFDRHFEDEESNLLLRRRRSSDDDDIARIYGEYRGNNLNDYIREFPFIFPRNESHTDYNNFQEGDILFDSMEHNLRRHEILNRKKRHTLRSLHGDKFHRKIADAKQWISETHASYAIHSSDQWDKICLKKSQLVNNINAFLPRSIQQFCKVTYLDVSDERFKIERKQGDLVVSRDVCIYEPSWTVTITFSTKCNRAEFIDAEHRLKIMYHHQELNDTDIAKRVKRQLKNQSPHFELSLYVASVLEEQPPGLKVTTVQARDPEDSPVVYSMISPSDARSQNMFKIDSRSGVITTSASLDREQINMHYFRVIATDDSFPPRSGTTILQINVLDCNDHAPKFETEQFDTTVSEGVGVGSQVLTLRATDLDSGKNAEIEYHIEQITSEGNLSTPEKDSQTFKIDGRTGVITTRSQLDRETSEGYTIIITANDLSAPITERKTATATVVVKISDENDHYPQFSERYYSVDVAEDEWGGSNTIAHIKASDADKGNNAAIRFSIVGGNPKSEFAIDSMSGEVSLTKPLDYEAMKAYRLVIRAQDGGTPPKTNTTTLSVNVIDANDNAPRFYSTQIQETVLESVSVGHNIVRVQAYDGDEGANAEITYSITDRDLNFPFAVDSRTGQIHTTKPLDREEKHRYSFQVVAVDGGIPPKSGSTTIQITVQDVNDNNPMFNPKYYEAIIGEDQKPGTPVVTVTASDPDEDSRLHYDIKSGNLRNRFSISTQNGLGLITIAQPLDYKQEKRFILTVTATDSGGKIDTATVNINITDANNFAPVFENAPYSASVFEDAPIGTTVLIVTATDADVGINAQITYKMTNDDSSSGMSAAEVFSINPQTGAIITKTTLDRETTSGYSLTVTAKDGGNPSHSETTIVEIGVTDVNDNKPVFNVPMYHATIPEDALIGTSVIQISATDNDEEENRIIRYMLSDKDVKDASFTIDSASGVIRTNRGLDRESTAVYHLNAIAIDKGTPPLSSTVQVQVKLEDVNDSPPTFPSDRMTFYIKENSLIGSTVGIIKADDPDEGVNAEVHYTILSGLDAGSFHLVTKPGVNGAKIVTKIELDYESSQKKFELVIRASSPPLRNDVHVEILVTDTNDNQPVLKNFLVIFNNFRDHFPSGVIGRIPAFDADVNDNLTYRILSGNNANLIKLNSSSGGITLSPQLNTNVPKFATMEVSVSDGINEVKATMQLFVRLVTEDMLFNSVTIRLNEMTAEAFLSPLLNYFLDGLAAVIPCPRENIYLFSIQEDTDVVSRVLNISFSARRPDVAHEEFYSTQFLQERVYLNRAILARLANVEVLPFDDNICVREPCLNYEQCQSVLKFGNASGFIHSDTVLFRPIYPVNTFACKCPEGFTGSKIHYLCDTEVDLCYSDPCQNGGICKRKENGYTCLCSEKFTGMNCEKELKTSLSCINEICESGYSCSSDIYNLPFTNTCELKARSFSHNSFLTFDSIKQRHRFNIKLKFATINDNGLLLYNGRYNDLHDFIALELIDGRATFSFSLGDKIQKVFVARKRKLSDGEWHSIEVIYFNRTATLVVDECDVALALSGNLGDNWNCANQTKLELAKKCSSITENCHRYLDLTGPLQVGGLPKIPAHFQIQSQDFVGCISDLEIDYKLIDMNSYVADNGTVSGCPEKRSSCSTNSPCFNGASCHDGWNSFTCKCRDNYTGNVCQDDKTSSWRFSGDGFVTFNPLLKTIQLPWLNALSIRTRQRDTFLMQIQIGQNSSAIVSLVNGILHYSFDSEVLYLPGSFLSDGEWHRIEIKWLGTDISLSLDYGQRETMLTTSQKIQGLYVGKTVIGSPDKSIGNIAQYEYLDGCIQDIRIGTQQSIMDRPMMKENVQPGCPSHSECPKTCPIHSRCEMSWDEAHCECLPGYVGRDCVPICTIGPCADAGVCRVDNELKRGYHCECNSTLYSGEYCEIAVHQPCPGGWWGEKSCGPCKCNVKQGYHADCNKQTGKCRCRENHYQPVNETACLPCDCYTVGSFSGACNKLTGQCECRDGVIGRRCDSCSNPYAEVTLDGCEVVYDACPKTFAAGVWWTRTSFGQAAVENCPLPARGKGIRTCDDSSGGWGVPNMFNCTSEPFLELRKQLSLMEQGELQLNTFVSVKMASDLQFATNAVGNSKNGRIKEDEYSEYSLESSFLSRSAFWNEDVELEYLIEGKNVNADRLYGADLLITEGILHELIGYEIMQSGLNLSHSQDKDYIRNLVESASIILDEKYIPEWKRLRELTTRGPNDLVDAFNKYLVVLARSQHDTYTNPFEITHRNMALGLDIVTVESLFGYEPSQLHHNKARNGKANQFTTESVIIPDTSAFLQHSSKQRIPTISFPKYNNFIQDKSKFDRHSKVLIPLDMLGIMPPEKDEISLTIKNYRAIVGYTQYKDIGKLFPLTFDDTVTRRWGVDVEIATTVLSLTILVPSYGNSFDNVVNKQMERMTTDQHLENRIDNEPPSLMMNPDDIKITVHDMTEHDDFDKATTNDIFNPEVSSAEEILSKADESNEVLAEALKKHVKRELVTRQEEEEAEGEEEMGGEKVTYRSLGSPHLSQPIRVQMWLNIEKSRFGPRLNPQCVRWHTFNNQWTRIGCHTEMPDYEKVVEDSSSLILINCTCTHVSSFAVVIDVIDPEDIPDPSLLVQITSMSAFLVSLPILFCVIIALALLRGMQTNSNTIHQNLVFCIFIAELLFFTAWHARRSLIENDFPCKLIAIGLHYSWLAAFAWTTVDCIHLYRMLTEMRDINHGPMGFYFTVGYGAPAILVGLSVGVRVHEYGNNMFCWLSVYESVVWWLVGPIAAMSAVNVMVLFISVKAAFTLKDHVLGFGNLRTLLWLSVVSLPLMGVMWVLSILAASESSEIFSLALSGCVLVHAFFSIIGYCIINKRVRENLNNTFLRCLGRKVPLLDSSVVVSTSTSGNRTPGFNGNYDTARRNIGISVSSTTSRSTAKTSSSPYRSDGQLRHTSTSTSNYNSDVPSFMKNYEGKKKRRHRKDSDSGSETDGRSLELASSHSSDDEESRIGKSSTTTNNSHHRNAGVSVAPSYLPNITEHVAPPELHVVQSPQLFPNSKPPYGGRWSSQAPDSFLPTPNVGRWSQETGSDNEIPHKTSSPNPLPNPDITDTSYVNQHQNKLNMQPPSILENIQENYGDMELYRKDYHDNYQSDYQTQLPFLTNVIGENEFPMSYTINHMRSHHPENSYPNLYEKSRTLGYLGSKTGSPYMSKERIDSYSPSFSTFKNGNTNLHGTNGHSVQSLLRNDFQSRHTDYHSDRNSEGSDKNGPYNFPYTAEEDHSAMRQHMQSQFANDINNPSPVLMSRMSSRHGSRTSSPPHSSHIAPLTSITDSSE
ncbi:CLUMA_CG003735, isoform A [Clunio marinus]|uniref:CLUMA_CG003735, isoform A n=1 Tax=Clunio marinus TaxID=568069 RepID=A0A1J1HPP8_9DIPT|nr:CLUMA_CG003735, isoform A [Clunio marinus]